VIFPASLAAPGGPAAADPSTCNSVSGRVRPGAAGRTRWPRPEPHSVQRVTPKSVATPPGL